MHPLQHGQRDRQRRRRDLRPDAGQTRCETELQLAIGAMTAAVPELVPAGGTKQSNLPQCSGIDPETGEAWGVMRRSPRTPPAEAGCAMITAWTTA